MKTYQAQPLDLMQYVNRASREPHISAKVMLREPINIKRLIHATDELFNRFPILKCSYEPEKNQFSEISNFSSMQVIVGGPAEDVRPEQYLELLDIRSRLTRIAVSGKNLYITVSHMVCDGSSFKSLVYMLCDIYNGKPVPATAALMKRDFTEYFGASITPEAKTEMLAGIQTGYDNPQILDQAEVEALHKVECRLNHDTMASIHQRARAEGVTLNDVFLTACVKTIYQMTGRCML